MNNKEYMEKATGEKWKLVNIEYNECELENEDTCYLVTLEELERDFIEC